MNELGARVRLVKGAYREPAAVAYQQKADVDAAYRRADAAAARATATTRRSPRTIRRMIDATRSASPPNAGIGSDRFEFQMLYGIRRDLQASLVADGLPRCASTCPFGREWFPYFMRRLGERPANLRFVLRAIMGEKK